tara:strand:+ start:111655 stop:112068 length:414 start_codon:yes stop_codon:yes gene_type:complete
MSQETESLSEMHTDHRHWKNELAMWRDDLQQWRSQHATAQQSLKQISDMIADHENTINAHEHKIQVIEKTLDEHEKVMAESLRGGSDPYLDDALTERHEEQVSSIAQQREIHERVKKQHHTSMAQVAILKSAFESQM